MVAILLLLIKLVPGPSPAVMLSFTASPVPQSIEGMPRRQRSGEPHERREPRDIGSPEGEMLEKANLEYRDAEQKRIVKSAEDIVRWSRELDPERPAAAAQGPDLRSLLGDIEKSAHRIRSIYGVGTSLEQLEKVPQSWKLGIADLSETAAQLLDEVKKTRREVVSVPVITASDKIVLLCRWLKESARPGQ